MRIRDSYIMREQVDNLIPTIMKQSVTNQNRQSEKLMSAISVAVVTFVYLICHGFLCRLITKHKFAAKEEVRITLNGGKAGHG